MSYKNMIIQAGFDHYLKKLKVYRGYDLVKRTVLALPDLDTALLWFRRTVFVEDLAAFDEWIRVPELTVSHCIDYKFRMFMDRRSTLFEEHDPIMGAYQIYVNFHKQELWRHIGQYFDMVPESVKPAFLEFMSKQRELDLDFSLMDSDIVATYWRMDPERTKALFRYYRPTIWEKDVHEFVMQEADKLGIPTRRTIPDAEDY